MKYPCAMIQDLLPLYLDGVCSEESKKAVEQHLSECPDCKAFYTAMCEEDQVHMDTHDANRECQKAASFQAVKKRIRRKQILTAVISVIVLLCKRTGENLSVLLCGEYTMGCMDNRR